MSGRIIETLALLTFASLVVTDVFFRKIYNTQNLLLLALFVLALLLDPTRSQTLLFSFIVAFAAALLALVLYALQGFAAGDVKLAFSTFLWLDPATLQPALIVLAIATFLLALFYGLRQRQTQKTQTVPFGAALSAAGITALCLSP